MRIAGRIPHEVVLRALLGARNGGGISRSCLVIGTDPNSNPIFGSAAHFKDCLKIADVIVASDELTEVFGECKQELQMLLSEKRKRGGGRAVPRHIHAGSINNRWAACRNRFRAWCITHNKVMTVADAIYSRAPPPPLRA